jgi:hypothetical protein
VSEDNIQQLRRARRIMDELVWLVWFVWLSQQIFLYRFERKIHLDAAASIHHNPQLGSFKEHPVLGREALNRESQKN